MRSLQGPRKRLSPKLDSGESNLCNMKKQVRVKRADPNFELRPEMGGPDYHQVVCDMRHTINGLLLLNDSRSLELAAALLTHLPVVCETFGVRFTAAGQAELRHLDAEVHRVRLQRQETARKEDKS